MRFRMFLLFIGAAAILLFPKHAGANQGNSLSSTSIAAEIRAAEGGDINHQYELANDYLLGIGVRQNFAEAMKWFRKAADRGHLAAQFQLGQMYHEGNGIARDDSEALKWLGKSADEGFLKAQEYLGQMYGNWQDYGNACMWLTVSVDGSVNREDLSTATTGLRDAILKKMTSGQINEAQRLAKEWESAYVKRMPDYLRRTPAVPGLWGLQFPSVLHEEKPPYTTEARNARIEGTVVFQCIVRKDGTVDSFKILRGLGYGLDVSAIATVAQKWRFKAGSMCLSTTRPSIRILQRASWTWMSLNGERCSMSISPDRS
jgi:TonB family protein